MLLPMLAMCLVASLLAAPNASATDDPYEQTDGLWVGHEIGKAGSRVTFELRGSSLVLLDQSTIGIMTVGRWEVAGPGGKGGDIQLATTARASASATRSGQVKAAPKNLQRIVRLRLWSARKQAVLCASDHRKKLSAIQRVPSFEDAGANPEAGVTCYALRQAWSPRDEPVAPGAPVVAPPEPDFECMRECRQQNMMRAVGADVIDADCRAACTQP